MDLAIYYSLNFRSIYLVVKNDINIMIQYLSEDKKIINFFKKHSRSHFYYFCRFVDKV